jgi:hypothetical protein
VAAASCVFLLLLARKDGLESVSRLGNIREIDFGLKALLCTRKTRRPARSAAKMGADFLRFMVFDRA